MFAVSSSPTPLLTAAAEAVRMIALFLYQPNEPDRLKSAQHAAVQARTAAEITYMTAAGIGIHSAKNNAETASDLASTAELLLSKFQ